MGNSRADYGMLCEYLRQGPKEESEFSAQYATAQARTAEKLGDAAAVYCLQEVGETNRPLIESLQKRGFQLFHNGSQYPDCAIALNGEIFSDVTNESSNFEQIDLAAVTATHTPTGQKILFVSAHVPGFNLDHPDPEGAAQGDSDCSRLADLIDEYVQCPIKVLGIDMNASPEIWPGRFSSFFDRQFQLIRTGSPTNVYPSSQIRPTRELDFILVKTSQKIEAEVGRIKPLAWDAASNASDHLPVFSTLRLGLNESAEYILNDVMKLKAETKAAVRECFFKYKRPELRKLGELVCWVAYRVLNALKSILGRSDWDKMVQESVLPDLLTQLRNQTGPYGPGQEIVLRTNSCHQFAKSKLTECWDSFTGDIPKKCYRS